MRIIAGRHRGLGLASVGAGDRNAALRPTSDRVREALFNVLMGGRYGDPVSGAKVLDLFAGTGALGLEALSRGASRVTFVDDGRAAQDLLSMNLARAGRTDDADIVGTTALRLPPAAGPANLIFLDPPYGRGLGAGALDSARAQGWSVPGGLVVWEERSPQPPPEGFVLCEHRKYGDTHLTFLEAT